MVIIVLVMVLFRKVLVVFFIFFSMWVEIFCGVIFLVLLVCI